MSSFVEDKKLAEEQVQKIVNAVKGIDEQIAGLQQQRQQGVAELNANQGVVRFLTEKIEAEAKAKAEVDKEASEESSDS